MKRFLQILVLLCVVNTNAQIGGGWDWAFNTGSLGASIVKHMKYSPDGTQILFGGSAFAAVYFNGITYTAPPPFAPAFPGDIQFLGKINSATGVPTILRTFTNLPIFFDSITTDDAGNFYAGGGINSPNPVDLGNGISVSGQKDVAIIKFDALGNTVWAKVIPFGAAGIANNQVSRLAVAQSGNIFFQGFVNNVDANNIRQTPFYKLDSSGNVLWSKSTTCGFNNVPYHLRDKFIDNNENVHLFTSGTGYMFEGVTYGGSVVNYITSTTLFSLNSQGVLTKAQIYNGGGHNFQVNRTTGNLVFGWNQNTSNPAPFNNLPFPLAYLGSAFANTFVGVVETNANFDFIRAKDFSTFINNPFKLTNANDIYVATPNGKIIIQSRFSKNDAYFAGVDYGHAVDGTKITTAIIETDADWNIAKFITGGKSMNNSNDFLAVHNDSYAMVSGFSNDNATATLTIPTTSYGTVNLTGFNAASNFATAYNSVYSTTAATRTDIAFAQCKSANFPLIESTTWLGTTNNWNTASNWSNGVPTASRKAFFNTTTSNFPTVSTTPVAATLQINLGVNITLPNTIVLAGNVQNNGNITLNNAGFFEGFKSKEWKGNGNITFTGTDANYFYQNNFTNNITLSTNLLLYSDLTIPTLTFNSSKLNLGAKKLTITNPNPNAISGTSATSYIYGGILERSINPTGSYVFPMGNTTLAQTTTLDTNNLVGVNRISTSFTSGAITGIAPNTTISGIAVTSALNGGWFTLNPNQQPTAGSYDITLAIQASTNPSANAGNYVVIKRDNITSPWATGGNYNVATTSGGIVTIKNSNLTSFSDFAIGRAASDVSLSNNIFTKSKLSIYPNPTSSLITISALENISKIELFDIAGKQILLQNINNVECNLDFTNLNSGIYFAKILMEKGAIHTQKIIKN